MLLDASYNNIYQSNISLVNADLQMLTSTGVGMVRIDLNAQPWLYNNTPQINEMNQIVGNISADGKKFCIADSASESYRQNPIPWAQFKQAWLSRVKLFATLYHPYCYIVVKEPGWYHPEIKDYYINNQAQNVSQWINLTNELAQAVHNVSPSTLVGVATPGNIYHEHNSFDLNYMQQALQLNGVNFIGFDIYGGLGFNDTTQFLSEYGKGNKQVWIAEAWSSTNPYNTSRMQSDAGWINYLYNYSKQIGGSAIIPFYTNLFSAYTQNPTISQFYQNRTPVFNAYRQIIISNG